MDAGAESAHHGRMGDFAVFLAMAVMGLSVGLAVTDALSRRERGLKTDLGEVAAALGLTGELRRVPGGFVIDGALLGWPARVVTASGATRLVMVGPDLPHNISIVALSRDPIGARMAFPEPEIQARVAARGDPVGLVGVLAPAVRAALAAANAAADGPHVELLEGMLRVDLTGHATPDEIAGLAEHLAALVAGLDALPAGPAARLAERVVDPAEDLDVRVRALRLAVGHHRGAQETEAALQAALQSGAPTLAALARAAALAEPLEGHLSVVGVDDGLGALSEVAGGGVLSIRSPSSGRGGA